MKLVFLITAEIEHGLQIAQAWQDLGAPGVTIVRSYGLRTLQNEVERGSVELPRMTVSMASAMASIIDQVQKRGELILSVAEDELIDEMIESAQEILGNMQAADTGVLFVLPIERAVGIVHHQQRSPKSL
jgi:nitrogen regulatory protein PII